MVEVKDGEGEGNSPWEKSDGESQQENSKAALWEVGRLTGSLHSCQVLAFAAESYVSCSHSTTPLLGDAANMGVGKDPVAERA